MFDGLRNRIRAWYWRLRGREVIKPLDLGLSTASGAMLLQEQFNRMHQESLEFFRRSMLRGEAPRPVHPQDLWNSLEIPAGTARREDDWPEIIE